MPDLDPARFPRAAAYLKGLPEGLGSYPACAARVVIAEGHAREHGGIAAGFVPPEPVGSLFRGALEPTAWVPEVAFQVANLMVRDAAFRSDAAFHEWTYEKSRELVDKPFLRTLMRLMSPTLIVVGSAKRWGEFHRGTKLDAGTVEAPGGRARTRATLTFPEGLFPKLFLEGLERAFAAAIDGARGKNPLVRLAEATPTQARFDVTWE